ncbi:FecR family protein [Aquiflexum sp.]|uniref:FecR family protein n=1 Tax=Aquiflexum sp. TaxID=1872584 RepID=UPI0035947452
MNDYNSIEDFLQDSSFKNWVIHRDPKGEAYWENWIKEHPDKKDKLLQARMILQELDRPGSDWDNARQKSLFSEISRRINDNEKHRINYPSYYSGSVFWSRAAIVTFLMLASIVAFWTIQPKLPEDSVSMAAEEVWITKANPKGQKSKIHLPDGSTITINADSEIRFKNSFGKINRDIFLSGESFFEVAPDSLIPFRVFTGELTTTALGTSFNINSYDQKEIQIQLATGKVKVENEAEGEQVLYLLPGEEVCLDRDSNKMKTKKFDLKKAFLWKEGTLLFEKASFSEFTLALERWYGVEIEVEQPPFPGFQISGEFSDTYLSNILESIGYAYGFDYRINHKTVKINFNQNR